MAELPLALAAGSRVVAAAAYTYFEWEDYLRETEGIRLLVQRKRNSRRADAPATADYKKMLRRQVETAFSQITNLFARKVHTTTFSGFVLKIALFITAFAINKAVFDN